MKREERTALMLGRVASPIGDVLVVADGSSVVAIEFAAAEARLRRALAARYGRVTLTRARDPLGASARLRAYFAGDFGALDDMPIDAGGTAFQRRVWAGLRRIPAGTTTSYGALARRLGVPKAVRAVGHANGANPISIVVPCHRVIGSDGTLTGYGGGLGRKRWLLEHEGVRLGR
ncbi:MAG: methylated-DNA--[protein]-cysteine S-methyltransferase [Alphaproteobacteria bacterium]